MAPGVELVPSRITASVQRLLDRLSNNPVAVFDAANNLLVANAPYGALMGDVSSARGIQRNTVWRHLVGPGSRAVHSPGEQWEFEALLVAGDDLRIIIYTAEPGTLDAERLELAIVVGIPALSDQV